MSPRRDDRLPLPLWVLLASLAALVVAFSQTVAFYGDEGFHLLAARLVNRGRRMYLDFFYQHVPLYVYITAIWMRVVGDTWRSVHALSALCTSASTALVTWYVFTRSRGSRWQLSNAASAAVLMGLNFLVVWYGTVGHPYGVCLLLTVAAFLLVVASVDRVGGLRPFLAGTCAGAAAASLLLTAPVAPILFLWLLCHTNPEARFKTGAFFLAGTALPFLPLLWLMAHDPRVVLFDVVVYQLLYRLTWADPWLSAYESVRTLSSWLNSPQALLLMLLASVAVIALIGANDWDDRRRREFRLCGWLVVGLTLFLAAPLPTFQYYFLPVVPFVSILAALGLNVLGTRLWPAARPLYVVLPFLGLFALGIVEDLAREVNRVTPQDGLIDARDVVLFAAGRLPPPGMENMFGPLLRLPPERLARLHILSQSQINARLAAGQFDTVMIGTGDSRLLSLGLLRRYSQHTQLHGFYILSGPISAEGAPHR